MRACVLKALGNAVQGMEYREDFPPPTRKPGEVLIDVKASSVNPADWKVRTGVVPAYFVKLPQILGQDVAGVVKEADPNSKFKAGDRVFGCTNQLFNDTYGTYAELVCCREERLLHMPPQGALDFEQAAAMPMAGQTAWQNLAPDMPLAGKRVMVHGGAGGIGGFAVQIAKAQGAYVATTCSTANLEYVKGLGADLAIDYTKENFEDVGGAPYDLVVDLIGGDYEARSYRLLKRSGRLAQNQPERLAGEGASFPWAVAMMLGNLLRNSLMAALRLAPRYAMTMHDPTAAKSGLPELTELVLSGQVRVQVGKVVALEEVAQAHADAERRHTRGKVVIRVVQ